jgi:hypothetical protein
MIGSYLIEVWIPFKVWYTLSIMIIENIQELSQPEIMEVPTILHS